MENKVSAPEYVKRVYSRRGLVKALRIISDASVILTVLVFLGAVIWLLHTAPQSAVGMAIVCAVPYIAVSVFRKLFNAPRPYELYDMTELTEAAPHKAKGASFPSRHVFSAFVISSVLFFVNIPLGIITAVLGVTLAVLRVLLCIHFVRDTFAGALIGIISGLSGVLILDGGIFSVI